MDMYFQTFYYRRGCAVFCLALASVSCLFVSSSMAGDLDDGISTYLDDSIKAADQLGDPDINFAFIEMRAKSRVSSIVSPGVVSPSYDTLVPGTTIGPSGGEYMGNINSVVLQPGSTVNGDIVIIDQSSSNKTLVIMGDTSYSTGLGDDYDVDGLYDSLSEVEVPTDLPVTP